MPAQTFGCGSNVPHLDSLKSSRKKRGARKIDDAIRNGHQRPSGRYAHASFPFAFHTLSMGVRISALGHPGRAGSFVFTADQDVWEFMLGSTGG